MKALLGTKIGMTQILKEGDILVPVTLIQAGPCVVTQIKTADKDGYSAVQVGFGKGKHLGKALTAHLKQSQASPKYLREFRTDESDAELAVGSSLDVTLFSVGDTVDVIGTSKGKGFAGNVKRNNFSEGRHTHGFKGYIRKPGSIGSMYPQRIFKGKRMAGHMGDERVTTKRLEIAAIDAESNVIAVKGAIPGPRRGLVIIAAQKKEA